MKKITLKMQGIDEIGCCSYFSVKINENYTMEELIKTVKERGYVAFKIAQAVGPFLKIK